MNKNRKRFPCVYYIKNTETGDQYIGSTFEYMTRLSSHLKALFRNEHHSIYLQRAWNKYGYKTFSYGIYEYLPNASNDELRDLEQRYFDVLNPCYNISPSATRNIMSKESAMLASERESKYYIMQDPQGKEHLIKNLAKFCRDNDIEEDPMRTVLFGNSSNYKGWRCRRPNEDYKYKNRRNKKWIAISPDGIEYTLSGLPKFCKEYNLRTSCMQNVAHGKSLQHKGWKCKLVNE